MSLGYDSQNSTTLINVFSNIIKKYHLHVSLKLAFLDNSRGNYLISQLKLTLKNK